MSEALNELEARVIYPAGDLASQLAFAHLRGSLLGAVTKTDGAVESFAPGYSPIANETPNPMQVEPVGGNSSEDYLGLGQAVVL